MRIHLATDHAGFELKEHIKNHLITHGYEVIDHGATAYDAQDDFTVYVERAMRSITGDDRGIILGGSGQGEAMLANRFSHIRAGVYYGAAGTQIDASGAEIDMIASLREHNDCNVLSLGARFVDPEHVGAVIDTWLALPFSGAERHVRRIQAITKDFSQN
ncbi:MAG: RpiB/LacA/LacB family sugar-phosphate isomerase [Candidatus Pacebacteria bacterium]|nr:RpiB/LacA/LacB family sugar-phosphate isomerase [Candidatus Paceibacterota bacterium]MCD8508099.1 RpiB/LacA/LacB family sugar-phosphate isomerase [Candidatus Paceibacterota bacterium]MCD8528091.1 RpiB/LacA/LacB family sugar-phosphate isomerase [Candidatus Paceibacterota bacterium]MCD8563734.1 RpiB/LacA/LacB family sugar-phosphate isomerase [Candidatus Paceibacterota bacterium]